MKILLHRLGLLGDTLGAYSVVPILKKHFADDLEIDWMVRPGAKALFDHDPMVKKVYSIKSRKLLYQFFFWLKNKFASYDLVINLDEGGNAPILKWIRAKQKLGLPFRAVQGSPDFIHLFSKHQYLCRQLLNIPDDGVSELPELFGVPFSTLQSKHALSKPYLVLALATSRIHRSKNYLSYRSWPLPLWGDFLAIAKRLPFQLVLVGTAEDKAYIEKIITIPAGVVNLMGKTRIPELITLVREASGVVTGDTGILHLASSLKTPMFAILGPTDPKRHGPFPIENSIHTMIRSGITCSPCELTAAHRACTANVCMQRITPDLVCAAIEARLVSN